MPLQRALRFFAPLPGQKCFPYTPFVQQNHNYMPPGLQVYRQFDRRCAVLCRGQEATTSLTGTFEVIC